MHSNAFYQDIVVHIKLKNLIIYILPLFVVACSNNSGTEKLSEPEIADSVTSESNLEPEDVIEPLDSAFAKYLEMIPELTLPYKTSCGDYYPSYPNIPPEISEKYSKWHLYLPYRKISTNKNFQIVMHLAAADYELPVLYTFTNRGDTISTKQMFFGYCGGEPGYVHKEDFSIDKELNIIHYDSTWLFDFDESFKKIEGTDSLKAVLTHYSISNTGQIMEN